VMPGGHAERDGRHLVMRDGYHAGVHRGSADRHGTGRDNQRPPGRSAGLSLARDLDEHRRGRDLARQFGRAPGSGGDLEQPGQGLLVGRSTGRDAPAGQQPLSARGIEGAASP
jgi:hypothetical protein